MELRRGVLILLFLILLAFSIQAGNLELTSPENNYQYNDTHDVSLKCTYNRSGFGSVVDLIFFHDISGTFEENLTYSLTSEAGFYSLPLYSLPNGTYAWNCMLQNATASLIYPFNYSFSVAVPPTPENRAPYSSIIPVQAFGKNTNKTLDLDSYFTDPDSDSMTYSAPSTTNVTITIDNSTGIVTIVPNTNWYGTETVVFSADDGNGHVNQSSSVLLNVTLANSAPVFSGTIDNETWSMNKNKTIEITTYFSDPDGDSLNYTISGNNKITIFYDSNNGRIIFIPETDWTGSEVVTIVAKDPSNASASSNSFKMKVSVDNTAPKIDSYAPSGDVTLKIGESKVLSITKSDPQSDSLTVEWYLDGKVDNAITGDSYTFKANKTGTFIIKVKVSDGSLIASHQWTITVEQNTSADNASKGKTVGAGTKGTDSSTNQTEQGKCGDSVVSANENCLTCPADVQCSGGTKCIEGKCIMKKKSRNWLIVLIVLLVSIGIGGGIVYFYLKKREEEFFGINEALSKEKEAKKEKEVKTEEKTPEKKREKMKVEVMAPKEPPEEEKKLMKVEKKEQKPTEDADLTDLKNYIRESVNSAIPYNQIEKALLEQDWPKNIIEKTYKEIIKEEPNKKNANKTGK